MAIKLPCPYCEGEALGKHELSCPLGSPGPQREAYESWWVRVLKDEDRDPDGDPIDMEWACLRALPPPWGPCENCGGLGPFHGPIVPRYCPANPASSRACFCCESCLQSCEKVSRLRRKDL